MNIARNTAEWVLTDSPPRYLPPPPGLNRVRVASQEIYRSSPQPATVYHGQYQQVIREPTPESSMNIGAQEWVPPAIVRRSRFEVSMDEAMHNLRNAFACAEHAKKIAQDAAIVAKDATIAAQIAKDAAQSASESVQKAANIVKELYEPYVSAPMPAPVAAPLLAPVAAPVAASVPEPVSVRATNESAPATSPIVAPMKVRHGSKYCFNKQKGRSCKLVDGKCKWCK